MGTQKWPENEGKVYLTSKFVFLAELVALY
jgi:hypothetical protein